MIYNQTLPNFKKNMSDNWCLVKIDNKQKYVLKD